VVELGLVAEVLTVLLAILSYYLNKKYNKAKNTLKALSDALDETYRALEDNKITQDEMKGLIAKWKAVINSVE